MADLPEIASFWLRGPLGWMERLCLMSYQRHGHKVKLFTPFKVQNVPEGVEVISSDELVEFAPEIKENAAPSFMADIFRWYLMKKTDIIWVDTDSFCYRPHQLINNYLIGKEAAQVAVGVMGMPKDSPAVNLIVEHIENPKLIPEWMRAVHKQKLKAADPSERLLLQSRMLRTVYGPKGMTYALRKNGKIDEEQFAQPQDVLYPVPWYVNDVFYSAKGGVDGWITDQTVALHFYGSQIRPHNRNKPPHPDSFMGKIIKDYGIKLG